MLASKRSLTATEDNMPPDLVPIQLEAEDWPYLSSTITVGTTATLGYAQDGVGTNTYMTNEIAGAERHRGHLGARDERDEGAADEGRYQSK